VSPPHRLEEMRVLVVDDHETVRRGVCSILETRKDVEICGEASNGQEAVEKTSELKPDLIVLDVTMPVLDGFSEVPILILSMHEGKSIVRAAQQAGVQGFVTKSEAGSVLLKAVDAVLQGRTFFPT
jgi:DNA-binding NarL/FixJ family response regulator